MTEKTGNEDPIKDRRDVTLLNLTLVRSVISLVIEHISHRLQWASMQNSMADSTRNNNIVSRRNTNIPQIKSHCCYKPNF